MPLEKESVAVNANLTLRGRVEKGSIVLIDDVMIADGSLVDVTIVQTPEQIRLDKAASERAAIESPLLFRLKGGQYTPDPLELLSEQEIIKKATIQFEAFDTKVESSFERIQEVIIAVILEETSHPAWLAKAVAKLVKDRFNLLFDPKAKAGQDRLRKLAAEIESIDDTSDYQIALWHQVLSLLASDGRAIPEAIHQTVELLGSWSIELSAHADQPLSSAAAEVSRATQKQIRQQLRNGLIKKLETTLVAHRRDQLHDQSETTKMRRKELTVVIKRLRQLS